MPAYRSPLAVALFVGLTAATLAADLGLKYWAFDHVAPFPVVLDRDRPGDPSLIPPHEPIVVVPRVLNLQLVTNTGAVFGLGKGGRAVFIVFSVVAVVVIGYLFVRSGARAHLLHALLALILAGALGNLYDRVQYAQVRDMLHLLPTTNLWPWRFNLADASLMIGVVGVLLLTWFTPRPTPKESAPVTD